MKREKNNLDDEEKIQDSLSLANIQVNNTKERKNKNSKTKSKAKSKNSTSKRTSANTGGSFPNDLYFHLPGLLEQHNYGISTKDLQKLVKTKGEENQKINEKMENTKLLVSNNDLNQNQNSFISDEFDDIEKYFGPDIEDKNTSLLRKKIMKEMKTRYDELKEVENFNLFGEEDSLEENYLLEKDEIKPKRKIKTKRKANKKC